MTTVEAKVGKTGKLELLGSKVNLPNVYAENLNGANELVLQIPPHACIDDGKDFKLPVHKVEEFGNEKLVSLVLGDNYLFLKTNKDVKAGDTFAFSLRNEAIRVLVNDEIVLEPVEERESLLGTFTKQKEKVPFVKVNGKYEEATGEEAVNEKIVLKSRVKFYYDIDNVKVNSPMDKVVKITTIEGPSCYKKQYKYVLDRRDIHLCEEGLGLHAVVAGIVDYGNVCYAKLDINGQNVLIEVDTDFNASEVNICFDGNDVEVYQIEIDMRIC